MQDVLKHDWLSIVGEKVEIRHHNSDQVWVGTVDAVTRDGRILWLLTGGPHERRMIQRDAGYTAWILTNRFLAMRTRT